MKTRNLFLLPALWTLLPAMLCSQTVATSPLGKNTFCAGETITVNYTATGTFQPGNAFIVQLSSPTGSFQTEFKNLGSASSTTSGSVTVDLPGEAAGCTAYRLRVIESNPRVDGSDNGQDLSIDAKPYARISLPHDLEVHRSYVAAVGLPIEVRGSYRDDYRYHWDFGSGATPTLSTQPGPVQVSWSTPGEKTVLLKVTTPNGCQAYTTERIMVYGPNPSIPEDVTIVQDHQKFGRISKRSIHWICPGGVLETEDILDGIIYVEAGGSLIVKDIGDMIVYVKSGGTITYSGRGHNLILYETGAGLNTPGGLRGTEVEMSPLTFDYSNVPPGGCPSLAPYTVQIKPNVNGIHTVEEDDKSDVEYWIWKDASLTSNGNNNIHCVEAGGSLTVNGDDNRIYLKEGAVLNVQSGTGNRIFYETKATIVNTGEDAVLLPSSGITFDVSQISSVAVAGESESALRLSPNPTVGSVEIILSRRGDVIRSVELLDGLGRSLYSAKGEGARHRIDLSALPSGVYHAKVETNTGTFIRKIVRE